jgi:hypothetical protein
MEKNKMMDQENQENEKNYQTFKRFAFDKDMDVDAVEATKGESFIFFSKKRRV